MHFLISPRGNMLIENKIYIFPPFILLLSDDARVQRKNAGNMQMAHDGGYANAASSRQKKKKKRGEGKAEKMK